MTQSMVSVTKSIGKDAHEWWKRYCHPQDGEPAARARLRRSRSAADALTVQASIALLRRLRVNHPGDRRLEVALGLARVLAHVSANDEMRPMRAAGWKKFPGSTGDPENADERPVLSEVRFRRLLLVERGEEQVAAFSRLVALLGGTVNIQALATDFWYWDDRTRRTWAFDYYAAGVAAPSSQTPSSEDSEA